MLKKVRWLQNMHISGKQVFNNHCLMAQKKCQCPQLGLKCVKLSARIGSMSGTGARARLSFYIEQKTELKKKLEDLDNSGSLLKVII